MLTFLQFVETAADQFVWLHSHQHGTFIEPTNVNLSHADHMKKLGLPTSGPAYDSFERGHIDNLGRVYVSRSDGRRSVIPHDVARRARTMFPKKEIVYR